MEIELCVLLHVYYRNEQSYSNVSSKFSGDVLLARTCMHEAYSIVRCDISSVNKINTELTKLQHLHSVVHVLG